MSNNACVSHPKEPSHRTNSLGFAKIDCHTCAELQEKCDRRRPQCGTCLSNGQKCGGFAMELLWKDPIVSHRASDRASTQTSSQSQRQLGKRDDHPFKFVRGRPGRKRRSKQSKRNTTAFNEALKASDSYSTWQLDDVDEFHGLHIHSVDQPHTPTSPATPTTWGNDNDVVDMFLVNPTNLDNLLPSAHGPSCSQVAESTTQLIESNPILDFFLDKSICINTTPQPTNQAIAIEPSDGDDEQDTFDFGESFPLQVTYQNLAHKYHSILTLYNEKFCVVPLSHDCRNNPFRMRMDFTESFTFLLHAVLAISSHHLAKTNNCSSLIDEMQKHWCTAIRLFSTALGHCTFSPLLDTLLILINIESTQSAYGMSDMHLRGAHRLLRESSAAEGCQQDPRLRAQLAMLIWWDVTASLVSRRDPRLPSAYLETLARYDDGDGWSFFTLTGCPVDLVKVMWQLARLAHTYERTVNMEWTIFNRLPVDNIIDQVQNYINYEDFQIPGAGGSFVSVDARRNRFHCIEAWRHAILLYVARVFTPKQDPSSLECIDHHARVIIDSVRCIPPTDAIQKQLLLPIFLAASEVGDDFNRTFVRDYCRHWSNVIHFYQFETVVALLEEVWNEWDPDRRDTCWWGIKTKPGTGGSDKVQEGTWMVQELLLG